MPDILHRIYAPTPPDEVFRVLSTVEGLAAWWTEETTGAPGEVGGTIEFRFPKGGFDMTVDALEPGRAVRWTVVDGPEEWVGTGITFDLRPEDDGTTVMFVHRGWREPVDFMYHCSTKWGMFLMSLKSLLETGSGQPAPHDVKIDNWN
ncbi:SRPBCC domain-containing protein [Nakamurella sp. YIM 132087]|uniref:SRPBCC domain-containing protein n=1 Tax=Nakamurella alba TaxID=2665158 RepID=A0A7K1FQK3_9ACTN|nr:SRPBCC domain-containing protein [Nakamurella alba]MTD16432.1 SRPBCC domain-containing protein [Nakamurella alba]